MKIQAVAGSKTYGLDDVDTDWRCGCSGETDDGNIRIGGAEVRKMTVSWTEIVTPFRDTVRFVNGHPGEFALLVDNSQHSAKRLGEYKLRSNID